MWQPRPYRDSLYMKGFLTWLSGLRWKGGYPTTRPQEDGQYFVYNFAGQWDSEWYDIGIYSNGKFHSFLIRPTFSVHDSVRWYAKLNNPARMPEEGKTIKVDTSVVDWVEMGNRAPSKKHTYLIYNIGGQFGADFVYDINGRPGVEWVDIGYINNGYFYGERFRHPLSTYVGAWWYLKINDQPESMCV